MFVGKASVEHLKGVSIRYAPALLLNIRLGRNGLPGTFINNGHKKLYNIGPRIYKNSIESMKGG